MANGTAVQVDLFSPTEKPGLDDWPSDYATQFWEKWPSHFRKHSQKQITAKLARIRVKREATWQQIWDGLCAYLASNPDQTFIPAPLVWINGQRWMADYSGGNHGNGAARNGSKGSGYSSLAAEIRNARPVPDR